MSRASLTCRVNELLLAFANLRLFGFNSQIRLVLLSQGGEDRAVQFEDRIDEFGSLRVRILYAAIRNKATHDIRRVFIVRAG